MTFPSDIQYFTAQEFMCKCGECNTPPIHLMDEDFVRLLDELRGELGFPFVITSGYRCSDHPIEARKAAPGAHTTGQAADIAVHGERAHKLVQAALAKGVPRIGVAQKGDIDTRFIHLDICDDGRRSSPWIWSY